jgi:hypothetical protein
LNKRDSEEDNFALFGSTARKLFPPVFGYKKWKRKNIILVKEKDVGYSRKT